MPAPHPARTLPSFLHSFPSDHPAQRFREGREGLQLLPLTWTQLGRTPRGPGAQVMENSQVPCCGGPGEA